MSSKQSLSLSDKIKEKVSGNARQLENLSSTHDALTLAYDATLEVWARALEKRKHETEGHIRRVTEMTLEVAGLLQMTAEQLVHVRRGALLHDIGEMYVPDTILLKTTPLQEDERAELRKHPEYAYQMLVKVEYLRPALDIPYCHHERWDGKGYPRGLKGVDIPLAARIFSVVDTWDALRAARPYRQTWTDVETWDYLDRQSRLEFDPAVVKMFTATYKKR